MKTLRLNKKELSCERPIIMGIINVTPDSFSDGGKFSQYDQAMQHIEQLISEGADIIDVGAESTRPGSSSISIKEEMRRLEKLVNSYASYFDTPLSIDTTKSEVAEFALDQKADLINDVSGLTADSSMIDVIAKYKSPIVIMHRHKHPKIMQDNPEYTDVVADIKQFFEEKLSQCHQKNIDQVILDPGIGFGKTVAHNCRLLNQLPILAELKCPLLIGTSRKSFIGELTGDSVENRLSGSLSSNVCAWMNGARLFRVHDVAETKKALTVAAAITGN